MGANGFHSREGSNGTVEMLTEAQRRAIESIVAAQGYRVGREQYDAHVKLAQANRIIEGLKAQARHEMGADTYQRFTELNPGWRGY